MNDTLAHTSLKTVPHSLSTSGVTYYHGAVICAILGYVAGSSSSVLRPIPREFKTDLNELKNKPPKQGGRRSWWIDAKGIQYLIAKSRKKSPEWLIRESSDQAKALDSTPLAVLPSQTELMLPPTTPPARQAASLPDMAYGNSSDDHKNNRSFMREDILTEVLVEIKSSDLDASAKSVAIRCIGGMIAGNK